MAKFADLPNELLIEIWSYMLQPRDIENFAFVSKTIRTLSGKLLPEHRKLTRQFSSFEIGAPKSRASAAGLLKEILTNPRVALYIRTVSIIDFYDSWESEGKGLNTLMAFDPEAGQKGRRYRHTPYAEEDMELFKQAMKKAKQFFNFERGTKGSSTSSYDNCAIEVELLNHDIERGQEFSIVVLLLLLLTNFESITVSKAHEHALFFETLRYISEAKGIEILKRRIKVRILDVCCKDIENLIRARVLHELPYVRTIHNDTPGKVVPEDCVSFDLRVWSSNVDGTLAIK